MDKRIGKTKLSVIVSIGAFILGLGLVLIFLELLHPAAPAQAGLIDSGLQGQFSYSSGEPAALQAPQNVDGFTLHYLGEMAKGFKQAVGDLDGDGDLDIVQVNENQAGLIFLNDGLGNFSDGAPFGEAHRSFDVKLGDLNGDGALDIAQATSDFSPNPVVGVYVYLNDRHGGFGPGISYGGGLSAYSIAMGDMNGDGALDIVLGDDSYWYVHILLNDGSGGFPSEYSFTNCSVTICPYEETLDVAVGDLNGDGALDIVQVYSWHLGVYYNDGAGGFSANILLGWGGDSLAIGDTNGDGMLDIVVGTGSGTMMYLNDGQGGFGAWSFISNSPVESTYDLALGDINGDGALDVVEGNNFDEYSGSPSYVLLNDGQGTFSNQISLGVAATRGIIPADFNGDGLLDITQVNYNRLSCLFINTGGLKFSPGRPVGVDNYKYDMAAGDFNGDGALDLVQDYGWTGGTVLFNDGSGQFPTFLDLPGGSYLYVAAVGDLNGDGALDIAQGSVEGGGPDRIFFNDGTGGFGSGVPFGDNQGTRDLALGDLDADGDLDIVRAYQYGVRVYWNSGPGVFTSTTSLSSQWATSLAIGDLNGDGALDIAESYCTYTYPCGTAHPDPQQSVIYFNDGLGNFRPPVTFGGLYHSAKLAFGDMNGDGAPDIVQRNLLAPNRIYYNDGTGEFLTQSDFGSVGLASTSGDLVLTDVNGDSRLDAVLGRGVLYLNDGSGHLGDTAQFGNSSNYGSFVVGDFNGDGSADILQDEWTSYLYLNGLPRASRLPENPVSVAIRRPGGVPDAPYFSTPEILGSSIIPITYTLFDPEGSPADLRAYYSIDGGGRWQPAIATTETITTNLSTRLTREYKVASSLPIPDPGFVIGTLSVPLTRTITDLDAWVTINHTLDADLRVTLTSPSGASAILFSSVGLTGTNFVHTLLDDDADTLIISGIAPFAGSYRPQDALSRFNGEAANGVWQLRVEDLAPGESGTLVAWGLRIRGDDGIHVFEWDTFASGFFGQTDNMVFRIEAYPATLSESFALTGTYAYTGVAPLYQRPYFSAVTFPFRVRGTQVQVIDEADQPVENAIVYRLPGGQITGGELVADGAGQPFHTDSQGYLQGRGQVAPGDQLLALAPITATESYTLYYTSGTPVDLGVSAYTVSSAGVQTLVVSPDHPLALFNLNISLEWDAHNDGIYLDQLQFNLQRASQYLYDFTNGQVALGNVNVFQNADEWGYSHVVIQANNRLRPFAAQGGIVLTNTLDIEHNTISDTIRYAPGQVIMGSTWNRYGSPGQSLGEDWPIVLAHELSHYLLFEDDAYLGMDENGYLVAVDACLGSAMGDLYTGDNTELIFDTGYWDTHCQDTLAAQTLDRTEWETIQLWYPGLIIPTDTLSGPALMPFDFTTVQVNDPYTPTATLADPTFYVDYIGGAGSSSGARAYLLRDDYVINQGGPFGGQNRLIARGAQPGDRLCVFDRAQSQYGCEEIALGDDRLSLEEDNTWNPIIQLSPVNSTTLTINVTNTTAIDPLWARIYPDMGVGEAPITLTLINGVYSGTFHLTYPAMSGNIQLWVDETASEANPRRETMVAFSIGGNPGTMRGAGGTMRGAGGTMRGAGGTMRGAGGTMRGAGAPILSPDGQMIFFTENPMAFITGTFFTIQSMAGLPDLPPGRTLVGQGYDLVASPGVTLPVGSVSIQYLSNDVSVAGVQESDLCLYFWDGADWIELDTNLDTYFNMASAPSQGEGVYALLASVRLPLYGPGWNLIAYPVQTTQPVTQALLSVSGHYTTVYGYEADSAAWLVYDVTAPEWVNTLEALEFGHGYWIQATADITLYLTGGTTGREGLPAPEIALPPATFYGVVEPGDDFTPTAGMPVTAWIGGNLCGIGQTKEVDGQVVYVVSVNAEEGSSPGCGAPGRVVAFRVDDHRIRTQAVWDNTHLTALALRVASFQLFLPVIVR